MQFKNPANGHIETKSSPALWAFLFGGIYFLVSGIWTHFIVWLVVSGTTFAAHPGIGLIATVVMGIVYAALAGSIVRHHYLRRGWVEVDEAGAETAAEPSVAATHRKCPYCAETILAEAIKCKHCGSAVEPVAVTSPGASAPAKPEAPVWERIEHAIAAHGVKRVGDGYEWQGRSFGSFADVERAIDVAGGATPTGNA